MEADFRGKVAFITGGSRGLGYLLAREFGRKGCDVAICARNSAELARSQTDLEEQGIRTLALTCDVANREQIEQALEEATRHYGQIDILVNNAGIIQVGPIQSMTASDFEEAMGVMFFGTLYPTLAVLPQMLERKSGWIVNITSIGGKVSPPHLLPYNSAKFAAVGLSQGLRAELAGEGISVTTIAPGLMRTGSHLNAYFKGKQEKEYAWFALGATLPLISMDAERAVRQIVKATARGDAEKILTLPASLLARFHGLFPGTTANLLGLVNRFVLPHATAAATGQVSGHDLQQRIRSRLFNGLTTLGRSAAKRFHELPTSTDAVSQD